MAHKIKLTDRDPSFVGYGGEGISDKDGKPVPRRDGIGLYCICPCGCGEPMSVLFRNPLDGGPPVDLGPNRPLWQREGDTFENLTLSPSILRQNNCRWHGYLKNGYFETV